jgi:sec-independent protein translocase protein TatC
MCFHIKELGFRCLYLLFSFICSCSIFFSYSDVLLEFIIISFNSQASGVFFCLGSLISRRINVRALIGLLFVIPFSLLQFGFYVIPSLFIEERVNFLVACFVVVFNFFFSIFVWWYYILPIFYFVFVSWFSTSGLAITYIPEITALIGFILFILRSFVFVSQLPSFLFAGIIFGFWDTLFLGRSRVWFYFIFVLIRTLLSPPEFWIQLGLVCFSFFSFEFTLFIASFIFVSKVFYLWVLLLELMGILLLSRKILLFCRLVSLSAALFRVFAISPY